jgi:hypothetical protein
MSTPEELDAQFGKAEEKPQGVIVMSTGANLAEAAAASVDAMQEAKKKVAGSCRHCNGKEYHCLGCKLTISYAEYSAVFEEKVAVSCNCCDHNFACKECYAKHPGYEYWRSVFGRNHAIYDHVSGENAMTRMLAILSRGGSLPEANTERRGNVTIHYTNGL